jgi:hypothetical protein
VGPGRCRGNPQTDTAAINECISDACDGLIAKAYAQCVAACRKQHQICSPVCSSTQQMSFIRWGEIAKEKSLENHPGTCSPTTCPACPVPTPVPTLQDEQLFIPTFSKTIDPWPLPSFTVTCRVNQWQFRMVGNITVTGASTGLTLHVPGTNGSPAIPCDNAPDISASGLGLDVTFHPGVSAAGVLTVTAEGALDGSFDGGLIDFLVDLDAAIKGGVHDQLAGTLNSSANQAQYVDTFNGLISQFLTDNNLPAVKTLQSVTPTPLGLTVKYF